MSIYMQRGVKVIITEKLACGHFCDMIYPMEEVNIVLKTGPLISINPTNAFPDPSAILSSLNGTLELSGKRGDVQYIGVTAKDGRLSCAECGKLLFALYRAEEEQ